MIRQSFGRFTGKAFQYADKVSTQVGILEAVMKGQLIQMHYPNIMPIPRDRNSYTTFMYQLILKAK